jgi:drug/metabolite transporter (DMT)-like permease
MNLTSGQIGLLVAFSFLLASGQILFKYSAQSAPEFNDIPALVSILRIPSMWAAIILYGFATLLWVYLLQQIPLSKAYPFVALGFILVPLAGQFLFGEIVPRIYWLGVFLILIGIFFTGLNSE